MFDYVRLELRIPGGSFGEGDTSERGPVVTADGCSVLQAIWEEGWSRRLLFQQSCRAV